jgi:hypothetical protein
VVAILSHKPAKFITGSSTAAEVWLATRVVVLGCRSYAPTPSARRAFGRDHALHNERQYEPRTDAQRCALPAGGRDLDSLWERDSTWGVERA